MELNTCYYDHINANKVYHFSKSNFYIVIFITTLTLILSIIFSLITHSNIAPIYHLLLYKHTTIYLADFQKYL